jgi:hypothetical protein
MHRDVKEILCRLNFNCPGCKESFPYEKVFEHGSTCKMVPAGSKYTAKELGGSLASGAGNFERTSIGNEVFVLDNDSFSVFVYNMLTRTTQKFKLNYTATDGNYSKYKSTSQNVLPHNF